MDNKKAYKTELEKREILRLNNEDGMKQSPKKMATICQSIFDGFSGIL